MKVFCTGGFYAILLYENGKDMEISYQKGKHNEIIAFRRSAHRENGQ